MNPTARAEVVAATYAALDLLDRELPRRGDWTFGDNMVRWLPVSWTAWGFWN